MLANRMVSTQTGWDRSLGPGSTSHLDLFLLSSEGQEGGDGNRLPPWGGVEYPLGSA